MAQPPRWCASRLLFHSSAWCRRTSLRARATRGLFIASNRPLSARRHELDGTDFQAVFPNSVPVPPTLVQRPQRPTPWFELEPKEGESRKNPRLPHLLHQRLQPGAGGEGFTVADEEYEEAAQAEAEEEAPGEELDVRGRAPPKVVKHEKWWEMAGGAANFTVGGVAPRLPAPPPEDGKWYTRHPRQIDADVPHVIATLPAQRGELNIPISGVTPWPEDGRWITADRHQKVIHQKLCDVRLERPQGAYSEWEGPRLEDALPAPIPVPPPVRWYEMDGAVETPGAKLPPPPPPPVLPAPLPAVPDDGKWFRYPNGEYMPVENWREC